MSQKTDAEKKPKAKKAAAKTTKAKAAKTKSAQTKPAKTGQQQYEFQAETRQLLDIVIHSLYSNKEIFLRELISNASDALDKLRHEALTNEALEVEEEALAIHLESDKDARTLTLTDNGIGMTRDELAENLGTIAQSGTRRFLDELKQAGAEKAPELIGQFGVGFYSAFMVSDHVRVESKAYGAEQAYCWESDGADGYTIRECEKADHGTEIG